MISRIYRITRQSQEISEILMQIENNSELERFPSEEKSSYVAGLF